MKKNLDTAELKEMGIYPQDYSTHSFRKGGLSVLGTDCTVTPAFTQKNAQHKHWASTVKYIDPTLKKALCANDLLCGNDPKEGWDVSYTGHKQSLQHHLSQHLIKHPL